MFTPLPKAGLVVRNWFRETSPYNDVQSPRCVQWPGIVTQDGAHYLGEGIAFKRAASRKHFIQDCTEAEYIATRIQRLSPSLFRRQVRRCSRYRILDRIHR